MPTITDPVEAMLAAEERQDHARAKARGQRIKAIVEHVGQEMLVLTTLSADDIRVAMGAMVDVLCDELYGNQAVDIHEITFLK